MKPGGGKKKGSEFERNIAKQIAAAFKPFGIEQRECWRSVLSGGHWISSGDLTMSDRLLGYFPFSVECKHRRKIDWWRFMLPKEHHRKSWEEPKWLTQAVEGAEKYPGLTPLLVMKENRGPIIAMTVTRFGVEETLEWEKFLERQVKRVPK